MLPLVDMNDGRLIEKYDFTVRHTHNIAIRGPLLIQTHIEWQLNPHKRIEQKVKVSGNRSHNPQHVSIPTRVVNYEFDSSVC